MKVVSTAVSVQNAMSYGPILAAGLLSGVLDLTAAFVTSGLRGASPIRVLQFIASGLLGTDSFKGGLGSASLGLVSHFLVAFGASAVFYAASRKLDLMTEQAIVSGILYGVAVYLFMDLVVVPLSAVSRPKVPFASIVIGLAVHIICVGLPISLTIRWYSK